MGTLGLTWTLSPEVRAKRYERFMKSWNSKDRTKSNKTREKISKARKQQALDGRAPETSAKIRRKISETMKEISIIIPRHNKGVSGYKNSGSFPVGNKPYNQGKKMRASTRKKLEKVWSSNKINSATRVREHNEAVLRIAEDLKNMGLEIWTCLDTIPDLIIKKNNKLIALEVTRTEYVSPKRRNKHAGNIFDEVRWLNLDGEKI